MSRVPRVSVIMPVYNAAAFLQEAIDSILEQTFTDWELICVNDASNDESPAIINSYTDERIRAVHLPQNKGVVHAMNEGLRHSTGRFVAVMHADDVSLPERLERQVGWLGNNPGNILVATFITMINEEGKPCGIWPVDREMISAAQIRKHMVVENCIAHSSVLIDGPVVRQYGYDSGQQKKGFAVEDYGLWLELLSDGYEFGKIAEPLLQYRVHRQSATSTHLRASNPFRINYSTKKLYLDRIGRKRRLNAFDKKLRIMMYRDYVMALGKDLKQKIIRR